MLTSLISTTSSASIDERCPMTCKVEGSDLATIVIGADEQRVELIFNATGLRRLTQVSGQAAAEMTALDAQETAQASADSTFTGGTPC